jgi:ATP-dependent exoDNAse (exonuclease V) alpha subunit
MTCHKFQGSSAADVLVIVETYGMDPETKMRWCYTAATRASETLTVLR